MSAKKNSWRGKYNEKICEICNEERRRRGEEKKSREKGSQAYKYGYLKGKLRWNNLPRMLLTCSLLQGFTCCTSNIWMNESTNGTEIWYVMVCSWQILCGFTVWCFIYDYKEKWKKRKRKGKYWIFNNHSLNSLISISCTPKVTLQEFTSINTRNGWSYYH